MIGVLAAVTQRKAGEPVLYQDPAFNFSLTAPADWMFYPRGHARTTRTRREVVVLDPDGIATSVVNVGSRKTLWPEVQNSLRAWADKEIADGEGSKTLKELTIRPDSWKDRTVAGKPGLSVIGDFVEGGRQEGRLRRVHLREHQCRDVRPARPGQGLRGLPAEVRGDCRFL